MSSEARVPLLTIGTRASPLALAQTHETVQLLAQYHHVSPEHFAIKIIKTTGDMIQDRALSEAGGKGLFTKELDEALLRGEIDLGVHSAKDLPTLMPEGIEVAGFLPREDVRDALICPAGSLALLPEGAKIGTASLRRSAQIRRLYPHLNPQLLRGNVETRLRKVAEGAFSATILALAGLKRLGLVHHVNALLDLHDFLPACGQGAIAFTTRLEDQTVLPQLQPILDGPTGLALACERAFLHRLDGSCRTPIAGLCLIQGDELHFQGQVLSPRTAQMLEITLQENRAHPALLGETAAQRLLEQMPKDFLSA